VLLDGARRDAGSGPITDVIDEAVRQLDSDIANLRGLIADLRPADIEKLGTEAAINALSE